MKKGLTYADVLIEPAYSDIKSREEIDIYIDFLGMKTLPFISAPMDYVTGYKMAETMYNLGAFGVVSRFGNIGERSDYGAFNYAKAVGVKDLSLTLAEIEREQSYAVCVDVAHGFHENVADAIEAIRLRFPATKIIAGNVATKDGFQFLQEAGAHAIRVGIGPGSACSTRENTGIGVPQLTAIMECATLYGDAEIIADGGIQTPGDIVKALAAGADVVMLGQWLAGHDETPGEIEKVGYGLYKPYRGQSSFGSNGARRAPEGVEGWVPYKGPVSETILSLSNYLRSGMSYVGARTINELFTKGKFIRVSPGTFQESQTRLGATI